MSLYISRMQFLRNKRIQSLSMHAGHTHTVDNIKMEGLNLSKSWLPRGPIIIQEGTYIRIESQLSNVIRNLFAQKNK